MLGLTATFAYKFSTATGLNVTGTYSTVNSIKYHKKLNKPHQPVFTYLFCSLTPPYFSSVKSTILTTKLNVRIDQKIRYTGYPILNEPVTNLVAVVLGGNLARSRSSSRARPGGSPNTTIRAGA